jgi:hypothetical protein
MAIKIKELKSPDYKREIKSFDLLECQRKQNSELQNMIILRYRFIRKISDMVEKVDLVSHALPLAMTFKQVKSLDFEVIK